MTLEKDIERKCVAYAKSRGFLLLKWSSPAQRGVPDRILIRPLGQIDFIEFKRPGGKPTKLQDYMMGILLKFGFSVHVIYSVDDFIALLEDKPYT